MTPASPVDSLLSHPAFAGLGAAGKALLEQAATTVRFGLGQPLASGAAIPNRVIWITTGQARCLFQDRGEWQTLCTATPGSLVGLASVLRAAACEEVSARSAIEGLAIPDQVVVQLLQVVVGLLLFQCLLFITRVQPQEAQQ